MKVEEYQKEIAIVTAYIQSNNLLYGSFFNTIDRAHELAISFVKNYYTELPNWDAGKIEIEFDEAIENYVKYNK